MLFLGSSHKRENRIYLAVDNCTDFLGLNKISELYIQNNVAIMFM